MKKSYVGDGRVVLIAGGGKVYTDIAARFVRSERTLEDIIASPYSRELVQRIIESGHEASIEFDFFIFGVEGYARVTEVQLVRKRIASYMIKTGRADKAGRRSFDVVLPEVIEGFQTARLLPVESLSLADGTPLKEILPEKTSGITYSYNSTDILKSIEIWYNQGVELGLLEEDLRYLKPQATEFKALIGMNAHALRDWFRIRCCKNAQLEIRDLAGKMLKLCREAAPDLFADAGPNCVRLGYCPENNMQHDDCRGKVFTKEQALRILKESARNKNRVKGDD